jgi:dihydrofolate synthase/folylpolyglutamate synthase
MGGTYGPIKPGLKRINRLLGLLGNPHTQFKTVQITGTNGKGSTASFLSSILSDAGMATGLFTSPHILGPEERISISGRVYDGNVSLELSSLRSIYRRKFKDYAKEMPTYFELLTALAFRHFAEKRVDIAVVETGLGGRLDAVSAGKQYGMVMTGLGVDHTEYLGSSLEEIFLEKMGALSGQFLVTNRLPGFFHPMLQHYCDRKVNEISELGHDFHVLKKYKGIFDFYSLEGCIHEIELRVDGEFQVENAALAVESAVKVGGIRGLPFNHLKNAVKSGIPKVKIKGRFQTVSNNPRCILDVGHNVVAANALVRELGELNLTQHQRTACVFTMRKNRDPYPFINILSRQVNQFIYFYDGDETHNPQLLVTLGNLHGIPIFCRDSLKSAMEDAERYCGREGVILITGSFKAAEQQFRKVG